jgi:hypothetical protein
MTVTVPSDARPWIERAARAGFAAKGVVYLLIGTLALLAAAGAGGETTGARGALGIVLRQPLGRVLLGLLATGLAGYAMWRAIAAVADPERGGRKGWKRVAVRIGYATSAVAHAALAWEAGRLALTRAAAGGDDAARDRTAELMSAPLGPWLVGAVALGLAGYGLAQILRGLRGDIDRHLALGRLGPEEQRLVVRTARTGLLARGVVFIIIGGFLVKAAAEHDPSEAGGLREALQMLRSQPYAPFLLGGVAFGLGAYGAFQLVRARYRVITTP